MAKTKSKTGPSLTKETWLSVKPPKSSMQEDYSLDFDHMDSPFEESFWNPGEVKDSRGNAGDAGKGNGKRQKGTQKAVGKEVVDI